MKLHGQRLDDESLRTFIYESEAIVNGRTLTVETLNDPLSPLPLTPSALLTGKNKASTTTTREVSERRRVL
jgi:hypothetical protein